MKLPAFTLVHRPVKSSKSLAKRLRALAPSVTSLDSATSNTAFSSALINTVIGSADSRPTQSSLKSLKNVLKDLRRQSRVEKIGMWDLSSQVGDLPHVIEEVNKAQPVFTFFEVQASLPAGMISRPERIIKWASNKSQKSLSQTEQREIESNIIFEDYRKRANLIRKDLGIDYLIGITPNMVAYEGDDEIHWNYFSTSQGHIALVSTFDLYTYSLKANRPFVISVMAISVAALLALTNPDLDYHEESRGCLFDFNRDRTSKIKTLMSMEIEPSCLNRIKKKYLESTKKIVTVLGAYRR